MATTELFATKNSQSAVGPTVKCSSLKCPAPCPAPQVESAVELRLLQVSCASQHWNVTRLDQEQGEGVWHLEVGKGYGTWCEGVWYLEVGKGCGTWCKGAWHLMVGRGVACGGGEG